MALSIGAVDTSAYTAQAAPQRLQTVDAPETRAPVRDATRDTVDKSAAQGNSRQQTAQDSTKQGKVATNHPGYAFEVDQNNNRIMKVSNSKGVLIYQVPSKGELALIEAEESAAKRLALTA